MEYKYQLILLGSDCPEKTHIISKLIEKIKDLNLPDSIIKFIEANQISSDYQGNQPAFGLYFGDIEGNHKHLDVTDKLLKAEGLTVYKEAYNGFTVKLTS